MDLFDLGFYSGDESLLRDLFYTYRPNDKKIGVGRQIEWNTVIEIGLLLEKHNELLDMRPEFENRRISPFLQFRVLQTIPDESAYSLLATCFDHNAQVRVALDALNKGLGDTIYVYELGGLGDIIEGFVTIRTMLSSVFKGARVVYVTDGKLARFLNSCLATDQIRALCSEEFRQISGNCIKIHALHLIALARAGYGILPTASARITEVTGNIFGSQHLTSKGLGDIIRGREYVLLNLRSLAKLKPEASRKSYFLRSVDENMCLRIIARYLNQGRTVLDLAQYPRNWRLKERLAQSSLYHSVDCMSLEFTDYAVLVRNAAKTITIDSMLTHLAAALGLTHVLLLPKGHDQRWIQNLRRPESIYTQACIIFKQSSLHDWSSLRQYEEF